MTTEEFNRLLRASRNGGGNAPDGEAAKLQELFRKMVTGFLRKKALRPDPHLIDDLVGAVFVKLYSLKRLPKGYAWNSWFWFTMKSVWSEYCKDNVYQREILLDERSPAALDWKVSSVPVPVQANAVMLEQNLVEHLRAKAKEAGPLVAPDKDVWGWAVNMLLDYGTIQNEKNAAQRSGLHEDDCRGIIVRAVVRTRMLFEDLYGREEQYTIEECEVARELAERIF
jgi:hypothetical protein